MFLPNPGVLAAGAQGRTYDEFVARINAISTYPGTFEAFNSQMSWAGDLARSLVVAANTGTLGILYGSPWGPLSENGFHNSSSFGFVARHGLPSAGEWSAQIASGRRLLFDISNIFQVDSLPDVNRNGAVSQSLSGSGLNARSLTRILYWGDRPMQIFPASGLGPEPYDW